MDTVLITGRVHVCIECDKRDYWGDTWRWFGSWKDLDDGTIKKFCSETCAIAWAEKTGAKAGDGSTPSSPR